MVVLYCKSNLCVFLKCSAFGQCRNFPSISRLYQQCERIFSIGRIRLYGETIPEHILIISIIYLSIELYHCFILLFGKLRAILSCKGKFRVIGSKDIVAPIFAFPSRHYCCQSFTKYYTFKCVLAILKLIVPKSI